MPSKAVPLVGGFYADDARPWSSQDVCEWIPVLAEQPNTLSPAMYRTPPGLKPYVAVDGAGPVRGARNVEGRLLVVMGNELFQISNTGVAIPRGTIPGVGPVQISHNQQGNSNQVIIVNGSAGYIYDTATLDVTRITDAGYPGAKTVDYLASYFLQVEPSGLFWFHSDLADGFAYNTLDRYESEAKPDRLVAVKSSQLEAVAFNQTTIEFFTNTGAATGTFQSKGIVIETGCASANGIVELDNSLMWLDNKGVFQRMEGYGARPISTRVLERAIADYDWSSAIAFVWEDRGHKVAYWTFRDGFTVGYDVTTGLWHRRASYGMNRWRLSCLVNWNGRWIGGDFQTGKLYELDWDYPYDGQDPMVRRAVTGALHNEQRRMSVPSIELVFDTGGPSVEVADFPAQPEGPTITGTLPDGAVGLSWAGVTYGVTGGTPPYTFTSRTGTTFPGNLGPMSSAGVVAAETPTTAGAGVNIPRVTDANQLYDQLTDEFEITVAPGVMMAQTVIGNPVYSIDGGLTWTLTVSDTASGNINMNAINGGRFIANNRYTDDLGATAWVIGTSTNTKNNIATYRGDYVVWGANGPFDAPLVSADNGAVATEGGSSGDGMYAVVYSGETDPLLAVGKGTDFFASTDNAATFATTGVAHGFNSSNLHNVSCKYSGGAVFAGANPAATAVRVMFTQDGTSAVGGDISGLGSTSTGTGKGPSRICTGTVDGVETVVLLGNANAELFWTQDEGTTWHLVADPLGAGIMLDAVAWNGVRFVLGGNLATVGYLKHSTDLVTWTSATEPGGSQGYHAIASHGAGA